MASEVEICNAALLLLGQPNIVSLTENTPNARTMNGAYARLRDVEVQSKPWGFAIKRATLAASTTTPVHTKTNAFTLPADFLCLRMPDAVSNDPYRDWLIEGNSIVTDDSAPLYIRYTWRVEDPNLMHPLFRDALAAKIAVACCEKITQSSTKKAEAHAAHKEAIALAALVDAFQNTPVDAPEDIYITVRS